MHEYEDTILGGRLAVHIETTVSKTFTWVKEKLCLPTLRYAPELS
jgi:hypothetical protein